MLNCYVVDDEIDAIGVLSDYINDTPWLNLVGSCTNPIEGLEEFSKFETVPEILFLDIHMPIISGIQFAEIVKGQTNIIFSTAYNSFGAEAFQNEAIDYLLKPFSYERFLKATSKVHKKLSKSNNKVLEPVFVSVNTEKNDMTNLNANEIVQIKGLGNYFVVVTNSGANYTYYGNLRTILKQLDSLLFVRCHKSHIVNLSFVEVISDKNIQLKNSVTIPIGKAYRENLRRYVLPFLKK